MHNYSVSEISKKDLISCSIIGARGYSGLETARLLLQHPKANLMNCFATSEFKLENYLSGSAIRAKAQDVKCFQDTEIMNHLTNVVFLATPAEVSLNLAPKILAQGKKVIDLSGAFRLQKHDYKKWYGFEHSEKSLLTEAVYGLTAFSQPAKSTERLIANPGCYATAISLALIPLLKNNVIQKDSIVIDAKSGTSGAGRKATENMLFTEVEGECLPYKVGRHQHYPEIVETVEKFSGQKIEAHFTTSLLPVRRGIIAGIYAKLESTQRLSDVQKAFADAYSENSMIQFSEIQNEPTLLSLKKVVGTNQTHISFTVVENRLYVFSCIDNLIKGAAGQAIENFNRINDLPIQTGLTHLEALT